MLLLLNLNLWIFYTRNLTNLINYIFIIYLKLKWDRITRPQMSDADSTNYLLKKTCTAILNSVSTKCLMDEWLKHLIRNAPYWGSKQGETTNETYMHIFSFLEFRKFSLGYSEEFFYFLIYLGYFLCCGSRTI